MIKQTNKPNITVFVGRSEQSDLRHLYLFVGRSEQSDLRHLTFWTTDLRHLTFWTTDPRQIAKKVTKIIFFQPQKTDENNPQTQTETNIRPILPKVTVMSKKVTIR